MVWLYVFPHSNDGILQKAWERWSSVEAFLGAAAELLYYSPHIKALLRHSQYLCRWWHSAKVEQNITKLKQRSKSKSPKNCSCPPKNHIFWNFTFKYSNFTHPPGSHLPKPRWPCNEYFLDDSMNHSWRGRLRSLFDRLCDQWLRQQTHIIRFIGIDFHSRTGEDTQFQAHFCFCVLGEGVIWDVLLLPDAKAALLSFFRSLVFGTVPEAISKLSLEGVGLKREKNMCVIKPIFFQDGEGKYV